MKQYQGPANVKAEPMSRGDYYPYRGWPLPDGEKASDPGYMVETPGAGDDQGPSLSWMPKAEFEATYREAETA